MQSVALQVVVPLLTALICVLLGNKKSAWYICLFAVLINTVIACKIFLYTQHHSSILYNMGGWEAPYGIELKVGKLESIFLIIISAIGLLSIWHHKESTSIEIEDNKINLFYAIFMLCMTGLIGIVVSNDIFNIYVFLEISSLSTYTLVAMGRNKYALPASFEYLIIGTVGATFYLIGIGLIYAQTGTLNITDLATKLEPVSQANMTKTALGFIFTGLVIKSALFPMHKWLIKAYTHAPSLASSFLSGTSTKVGIYLLIKMIYGVFGIYFVSNQIVINQIIMLCSLLAILSGSFLAIFQTNFKRLLAYSSVSQIGYIIASICLKSQAGLIAGILQLIGHSLAKSGLFMVAGSIGIKDNNFDINKLEGLGKRSPITAIAITICLANIAGIPITIGFVAKWHLLEAAISTHQWILVIAILCSSLMAIIYSGKIMEKLYFNITPEPQDNIIVSKSVLVPSILIIIFGCNLYTIMNIIQDTTTQIITAGIT